MIQVTQNADGTLLLVGAKSVTVTQMANGLQVSADDTIGKIDNSAPLQAKIDAAKADLAKVQSDLA